MSHVQMHDPMAHGVESLRRGSLQTDCVQGTRVRYSRRLEDEPVSAFESLNLLDKERRAQRAPPCLETNLPAP